MKNKLSVYKITNFIICIFHHFSPTSFCQDISHQKAERRETFLPRFLSSFFNYSLCIILLKLL